MKLTTGIVRRIDDPAGKRRVQVELPLEGTTQWAELLAPLTTQPLRAPVIGAAVIVGFLNDDINAPIVIGERIL